MIRPGDPIWFLGYEPRGLIAQPGVYNGERMSGEFHVTLSDGRDVSLPPHLFTSVPDVGVEATPED